MERPTKTPLVKASLVPFMLISYGPLLVFLALLVPGVFFLGLLGPDRKLFILLGILAIVYPAFLIRISYQHCLYSASWLNVGLKLYGYSLLACAPLLFLLLRALAGGASAATDSVVAAAGMPQYGVHAAILLFVAQAVLVPWLFIGVLILRRLSTGRRRTTAGNRALVLAAALLALGAAPARAATLSERGGPLVQAGEFLLTQDVKYFTMHEAAEHASAAYGAVDAAPAYLTLGTRLTFAVGEEAELSLGHAEAVPADYRRAIFKPAGALDTVQEYELNSLRDYVLAGRLRRGPFEPSFSFTERTQRASWFASTYPAARSYFSYIRTRFEQGRLGVRYLSAAAGAGLSEFALLEGALLAEGQVEVDAGLDYSRGRLRRDVAYYTGGALIADNMYHDLKDRFEPGVRVACGISDGLEVTGGVAYAAPYDYVYEYRRSSVAGLAVTHGDYATRHETTFPLGVRYRPLPHAEARFTSDIVIARQRLDYWKRATTGVVTSYPARKLKYFNIQPSLTVTYLFERGRTVAGDDLARLAGTTLARGQCLLKFSGRRDVTHLDKSAGNGGQNRIDPDNVFLYPLDYYVAGTEDAAYFTGNTSTSAANVAAQDYGLFRLDALYGVTDSVSAGVTVGYRTSSRFHHFTVGSSSAFDLNDRSYVLKPYWFFGVPLRWRPARNVFVTVDWRYVPCYRSTIDVAGQAEDFKAKTDYHTVTAKIDILF
ncbi:MAG: hypothetical protein ACM3L6_03685 [Deltaproteobacteria bacterium]